MPRLSSILLALALGAACGNPAEHTGADGGSAAAQQAIMWPIEAGTSSFVTQSAARSEQPFPCGSGVNSQHILQGDDGENHDYEQSLDIVVRNPTDIDAADRAVPFDGRGTAIVAVADGIVVATGNGQSECQRDIGAGNYVIVQHPQIQSNGTPVLSAYMHLNSGADVEDALECGLNPAPTPRRGFRSPAVGSAVVAGQKIGELGNTGNSTGAHLHFQFATDCTLQPADRVACTALSTLEINPAGFSNVVVTRDESCPARPAVGGPVANLPSSSQYLSDGSYVMATRDESAPATAQHLAAR